MNASVFFMSFPPVRFKRAFRAMRSVPGIRAGRAARRPEPGDTKRSWENNRALDGEFLRVQSAGRTAYEKSRERVACVPMVST
jgi:hypothetical protein